MRLRITFSKSGALRYTGHLDLHRIWERTSRRANIPLSYSQGFHPQPRISLAAALPLGFIGRSELVDIWLDQDEDLKSMIKVLQVACPPGLDLTSIQSIDLHQPALQTLVESADYEVIFLDPVNPEVITSRVTELLSSVSIPRQRRGKNYDLRSLILSLEIQTTETLASPVLLMSLRASPAATGRPEEVLSELGILPENTRITRTRLVLKNG
jgi:radical SAM-linked protein